MEVESIFENLPNFRQAGGKGIINKHGQKVKDGLLFRSSRTDFITDQEKAVFDQLGIKCIVDLRGKGEYERADGEKALDDVYRPCVLDKGKLSELKSSGSKVQGRKTVQDGQDSTDSIPHGLRYLVNMMTMDLLCYLFHKLNFFVRYLSLILLLVDRLCGCQLFMKFFSWAVLNRQEISQLYVDILEFTKPAVVDVMRLIVEGDNIPMLIICAHGKDRTGVITAVILACLEVDDEIIAQDYAQSEVRKLDVCMHTVAFIMPLFVDVVTFLFTRSCYSSTVVLLCIYLCVLCTLYYNYVCLVMFLFLATCLLVNSPTSFSPLRLGWLLSESVSTGRQWGGMVSVRSLSGLRLRP